MIKEAIKALHQRLLASDVETLTEELRQEDDSSRRLILLDALTSLGDPGAPGCPFPEWVRRVATAIPQTVQNHFFRKLSERQRKAAQGAQSDDRQRRS